MAKLRIDMTMSERHKADGSYDGDELFNEAQQ